MFDLIDFLSTNRQKISSLQILMDPYIHYSSGTVSPPFFEVRKNKGLPRGFTDRYSFYRDTRRNKGWELREEGKTGKRR